MDASSISGNGPSVGRGTLSQDADARAPDPAWTRLDIAGLDDASQLCRLHRPEGRVEVEATDALVLAVRVNLVARERSIDRPDPARLKPCVAPDYFILIPAGGRSTLASHAAQDVLRLTLRRRLLARVGHVSQSCPLAPLHGRVLVDPMITGLVEQLAASTRPEDETLNRSAITTLVLSLIRMSRTRALGARVGGLTPSQLGRVRDHVEARLATPLRLPELAEVAGLSAFHFARAFKASMGAPPGEWIRMRRLTVAQALLEDGAQSITDVAAAVGYESPSRFARAFRAATGQSPSRFRRAQA